MLIKLVHPLGAAAVSSPVSACAPAYVEGSVRPGSWRGNSGVRAAAAVFGDFSRTRFAATKRPAMGTVAITKQAITKQASAKHDMAAAGEPPRDPDPV